MGIIHAFKSFPGPRMHGEQHVAIVFFGNVAKCCKYVFFAIKPQQLDEVLDETAKQVTADTVIVSILAGVTDEYYAKRTVPNAKVVLVMPNTPFLLGEGATALSRSASVTDEEFDLVCRIFSSGGIRKVISKDKMKEIIAINGSSPAFIYLYTKYFVDYAKSVDIDEETAKELFAKSLIGSAKTCVINEKGALESRIDSDNVYAMEGYKMDKSDIK